MRLVAGESQLLGREGEECFEPPTPEFAIGIDDLELWEGEWLSAQDLFDLLEVVEVDMSIPEAMDEAPGLEVGHVSDEVCQERIARDIEGDPEEEVGRPLEELAVQPLPTLYIELEEGVAGWEVDVVRLPGVPTRHDHPGGGRPRPDLLDHPRDLVDPITLGVVTPEAPPEVAIDRRAVARLPSEPARMLLISPPLPPNDTERPPGPLSRVT